MLAHAAAVLAFTLALTVNVAFGEQPHDGKNWVLIVAGSNSWYNYRHQVRRLLVKHLLSKDVVRLASFSDHSKCLMNGTVASHLIKSRLCSVCMEFVCFPCWMAVLPKSKNMQLS